MIPTVIGVVLLTFFLFNVAGGDLAATALGKKVSLQEMENFDAQRGLNRPLFFGTRAKTRAYSDLDFSEGIGRWGASTNVVQDAEAGTLLIAPDATLNPLGFALKSEHEWTLEYRADGPAEWYGSELAASADWTTVRVRVTAESPAEILTAESALELRSVTLRRVLDHPFESQLFFYVQQLCRGDLGRSEYFKQPVGRLLAQGVIPSLSLTIPIFVIGLVTSITLALICAFFRNTFIDRFLVLISVALMSINYLVYIVAGQYVLAYRWGMVPVWGYESWRYLVLPVAIGVISGLGGNVRFYRTIMLDEMYKEYVRTAMAKGVSRARVLFVHVLKNAMIPIVTNVVIAIPFLYTGSLLLESFFGIPGLGYIGVTAINSSDIDVVRALVLIGAMIFVVANLLTDLCYALVDPRAKVK
jgi:peptide/nickel transport system permease protein